MIRSFDAATHTPMEPTTIVFRDPFQLRFHPLQKHIPDPDRKSPDWAAFVDSVQASGILHPLIITKDGQVMDGARRWRAAKELELPQVPCVIRDEAEAGVIIAETLIHRRLMTRGAAVYLVLPMIEDFIRSAESRRLGNLRRGVKTREIPLKSPKPSTLGFGSIPELCQSWGISDETLRRAQQVREIFSKRPDLKKELEPQLLSGEKNLWNVLSAAGGADTDQSGRILGVFKAGLRSFVKYGDEWKKLSREDRKAIEAKWREDAAALPQDLRNAIADVLLEEVGA